MKNTLAPLPDPHDATVRFVALDVETASRVRGSICQIGLAIMWETGKIGRFETLIDPQTSFDPGHVYIHGITAADVAGAPRWPEVFAHLAPFLAHVPIIEHSRFDEAALRHACEAHQIAPPEWTWYDSVVIARRAWPEFKGNGGHGLAHLKEALGLEFTHHDAAEDARASAMVTVMAEARTGLDFRTLAQSPSAKSKPRIPTPNPEGAFFGEAVVFSGRMRISRASAMQRAAKAGMAPQSRATDHTTVLVLGTHAAQGARSPRPSAQQTQVAARIQAGQTIRVIDDVTFLALLNEVGA